MERVLEPPRVCLVLALGVVLLFGGVVGAQAVRTTVRGDEIPPAGDRAPEHHHRQWAARLHFGADLSKPIDVASDPPGRSTHFFREVDLRLSTDRDGSAKHGCQVAGVRPRQHSPTGHTQTEDKDEPGQVHGATKREQQLRKDADKCRLWCPRVGKGSRRKVCDLLAIGF